MPNEKGSRRERELRSELREAGFTIVRVAGSGGGTLDDLPDLFVGNGTTVWAIEVKTSDPERYIYLDADEVASLEAFAEQFHEVVVPKVAVRWDHDTDWYVRHPMTMHRTESGSRRASHEGCQSNWPTLQHLTGTTDI